MSEPKPMPSYWALAEEVTHLHGQLDKLKAENEKLRTQLADVTESMGRVEQRCAKLREECDTYCDLVGPMDHQDFIVQLHTENFKLRYLAADMLKAMRHMEENTFMNVKVSYSRWFAPKLHELGVEV